MKLAVPSITILALACFATSVLQARELTIEDRVEAQERVEYVYTAHRSGRTQPFDEAIPRHVLERKVRDYLDRSVALEHYWGRPVSAEALRSELERIARGSRMPERLLDLYAALGDDAFLIQETLARRTLVRRLTRNLFAFDERIHGELGRIVEQLREQVERKEIDPRVVHPDRQVLEIVRGETLDEHDLRIGDGAIALPPEEYERLRASFPPRVGQVGQLTQDLTSFSFPVLLSEELDRMEIAVYRMAKRSWEDWLAEDGARYAGQPVSPIASDASDLPQPGRRNMVAAATTTALPEECTAGLDDVWEAGFIGMLPEAEGATAVWTGTEMIVWGGTTGVLIGTGARYDPLLDVWTQLADEDAPEPRFYHTAVWSGSEMIIWGGVGSSFFSNGGRYNPLTDTWTPLTSANAPAGRSRHTAVWAGGEMIVWGGSDSDGPIGTGSRYDPLVDSWSTVSMTGAPTAREQHTAVWTGSEMIIWGGGVWGGASSTTTNTGGHYDPVLDQWAPTSTDFSPSPRWRHTAVWTGNEMIVWGGENAAGALTSDGGRLDPSGGGPHGPWAPVPSSGWGHQGHAAVWTGNEMIVWGGSINKGERYDPSSNSWADLPDVDLGSLHDLRTAAVWTGSEMIVWHRGRGARFDPLANSWSPNIHPVRLAGKSFHSAVWTGSEMIVWGGFDTTPTGTGGRYDPVLDSWDLTTMSSAPLPRSQHTAVWNGNEMIVWGGSPYYDLPHGTGGRYDPLTDSWSPVSTTEAPDRRANHTAVWTGTEMIVWGGSGSLNSGGCYDSSADTWSSTSTSDAPAGRSYHTAVWTGSRMIIWGGEQPGTELNTGALYDPEGDSWIPTSLVGVPPAARRHVEIWTGNEMIVWGDGTSARYDPTQDTWSPVTAEGAPEQRNDSAAVWTGEEMIVWGGRVGLNDPVNSGGRFDPIRETWTATSLLGGPASRYWHTAVWTGEAMIVWGGVPDVGDPGLHSGFLYFAAPDADNDGITNACDCAPDDPLAFDTPAEIQNVRWLDDSVTVEWDSDAPNSGTGTVYDVVRGDIATLPVGGPSEFCLESDSGDTSSQDPSLPPAGFGFYYLVRGENACDIGDYGTDSFSSPRTTAACP